MERDRKKCAENAHRLNEQYLAHFSTLDLALRIIDISLPVFEKREQELEREVAKSRQLQISLQEEMSQLQNSTADKDTKHLEEKMGIEEAILKLMLQIVQLGSELRFLKLEKEYISTNNKIVLEKQTELETSLLDLQSLGAPLENIETHLTKQLEQAQESLRTEQAK
ncbi:hypothetical protein B566_EDAN013582 [Ephemera danica]|nr:hypothetical protein B566_EDAN013582 [Ephemera danica]